MPTWIRVRDDATGAEYDVEQASLRGGLTPIDGYPVLSGDGAQPRPPKPLVAKDGTAAATTSSSPPPGQTAPHPALPAETTSEEKP